MICIGLIVGVTRLRLLNGRAVIGIGIIGFFLILTIFFCFKLTIVIRFSMGCV